MNKVSEIMMTMKKKIPVLPLTVHLIVIKSIYEDYDADDISYMVGFWIYYPILCLMCCTLEGFHSYMDYKKTYPHRSIKERICYTGLSTFISFWIFVVTCYYIEDGVPFSDIYPYNKIITSIIFYSSYGLIGLITYLEHFQWPKLVIIPTNYQIETEILTPRQIESNSSEKEVDEVQI